PERHPGDRPVGGALQRRRLRAPVQDAEIQREQDGDEREEAEPKPDHRRSRDHAGSAAGWQVRVHKTEASSFSASATGRARPSLLNSISASRTMSLPSAISPLSIL